MTVEKFSISLPSDLVADVESIADQDRLTRSAVIREATVRYVAERKSATYEAERRARIGRAIEGFKAAAEMWGPDERPSLSYLREIRGDADGRLAEQASKTKTSGRDEDE